MYCQSTSQNRHNCCPFKCLQALGFAAKLPIKLGERITIINYAAALLENLIIPGLEMELPLVAMARLKRLKATILVDEFLKFRIFLV